MRQVRNATIAAASVVTCFAFVACTSEPPKQLGGQDVTDLAGSLADISARWRATLAGLGPSANLPAGARCYVEGAGGQALGSSVICGPVRLAGDGETTWQSHAVVGSNTPSGVRLVLAGSDSGTADPTFRPRADVGRSSNFVDADGVPVPLDLNLDPPALDQAAPDDPQPMTATFADGTPITVRTPSGPVSLSVALTPDDIGPASQQLTPPTGGSFVLVAGTDLPDAAADDADVSVVVSHDGKSVTLPVDQLAGGVSVGMAKGSGPVTIGVGYDGLVQRFDATNGRRLGNPAASLYDGIGDTIAASCPAVEPGTVESSTVSAGDTKPGSAAGGWEQRFHCDVVVNRSSYLPAPPDGSPRTVQGWAGEGQTWAVVSIEADEQTAWVRDGTFTQFTPTYFSFGTRLRVDGVEHAPRQLYVEQAEKGNPARVTAIFSVPAGQRTMALSSFVTTNITRRAATDDIPAFGAFTYPADATFTFGGATG